MFKNSEERINKITALVYSYLNEQKNLDTFSWEDFFDVDLPNKIRNFLKENSSISDTNVITMQQNICTNRDLELLSNIKNKILKENNVTSFKLNSYEEQIEVWHRKEEDSVSLHKFLGLTWREYQILNQSGSVFN